MATQTKSRPRRSAGGTSARFSRSTAARTRSPVRIPKKKKQASGLAAVLTSLPGFGKTSGKGGSSKAKPAAALFAAGAGALLGRQQMRKRKHSDTTGPAGT